MAFRVAVGFLLANLLALAMSQSTVTDPKPNRGLQNTLVLEVAKLSLKVDHLTQEINNLKNQNNGQSQQLSALQNQDNVVRNELAQQIGALRGELAKQTGVLKGDVAKQTASLNAKDEELQSKIQSLERQDNAYKTKFAVLESQAAKASLASAFSAGQSRTRSYTNGHRVVFDSVKYMYGYGYNSDNGQFTAPVKGIYAFHLSMMIECDDCSAELAIISNGKRVGMAHANEKWADQSSVSAVVDLNPGEIVEVKKQYGNAGIRGFPHTVFSGYLIKAM